MATLTVQAAVRGGIVLTEAAAAAGGDEFTNTGKELIFITNGDVSGMTLTIVTQNTSDGLAVNDRTVSIGAGETQVIGPWTTGIYNDGGGKVQLTYSSVVSLTISIVSMVATT